MSNYRKTMTDALREMYLDESVIDKVKEIASKKSAKKIDGVMVDSFTASAISQIYDKVNDANKKKMDSLPIIKLANLAFKMMQKNEFVPEEVGLDEGPMDGFLRLTFKSPDDVKKAMKVSDTEFGKGYFSMDKARTRPEVDFEGDRKGLQRLKDELKSAGIKFEIDLEEESDLDEAQDGGDFKPHMMYDPKTGKGYKADTMDDHLRMKKMGYTHDAPKTEEADLDEDILPQLFMGGIAAAVLPAIFISMREIIRGTPLESSIKKIVDKLKKDKNYKISDSEKSDVKGFVSKVKKDKPSLLQKAMKKFKEEADLDEGLGVAEDVPAMEIGTDRYREYAVGLTPGENAEFAAAQDFKVASMKEALAKVWGLDEKKLDKASKEAYDEEDEQLKPVKGSKTMTGGKIAKVDTKPKIG